MEEKRKEGSKGERGESKVEEEEEKPRKESGKNRNRGKMWEVRDFPSSVS